MNIFSKKYKYPVKILILIILFISFSSTTFAACGLGDVNGTEPVNTASNTNSSVQNSTKTANDAAACGVITLSLAVSLGSCHTDQYERHCHTN